MNSVIEEAMATKYELLYYLIPKDLKASQEMCKDLKYVERKQPQPKFCSKPAVFSYSYEQVEMPPSGKTRLLPL